MIRKLDKAFLSPLLCQYGFKKKGLTWNHGSGDIVRVLNFQVSRYSGPDRIDFTINLGIWMRDVWMVNTGKQPPAFIKESECWPSYRVGDVIADFHSDALDLWWKLTNEDDVERVGDEIRTIVSNKCLPFLDRFQSLTDVKQFYDTVELRLMPGDKLNLAVLSNLLGDQTTYNHLIAEFSDKKLAAWQPKVAEVVQRLHEWTGGFP